MTTAETEAPAVKRIVYAAKPLGEVEFDERNEVMYGKHCQTGLCFV